MLTAFASFVEDLNWTTRIKTKGFQKNWRKLTWSGESIEFWCSSGSTINDVTQQCPAVFFTFTIHFGSGNKFRSWDISPQFPLLLLAKKLFIKLFNLCNFCYFCRSKTILLSILKRTNGLDKGAQVNSRILPFFNGMIK